MKETKKVVKATPAQIEMVHDLIGARKSAKELAKQAQAAQKDAERLYLKILKACKSGILVDQDGNDLAESILFEGIELLKLHVKEARG